MRADARKIHSHLFAVAREVVAEQGAAASLREIARRADVGLGTLYRHFPTREALFEALLRGALDELTRKAGEIGSTDASGEALVAWFRDGIAFVRSYRGVVELMAGAIDDPQSALYAACTTVRSAGASLLQRAQAEGVARADIDGADLFALMASLGWLGDQAAFAPRAEHLADVIASALLTHRRPRSGRHA